MSAQHTFFNRSPRQTLFSKPLLLPNDLAQRLCHARSFPIPPSPPFRPPPHKRPSTMYIRAATPSTESVLLSYTSVYPECPPAGPPHCAPTHMSPGPALPSTAQPSPETAYAADIQQFGQRNFVGLIVLGVFVSVGLVLWLTFGTWPKAFFWRIRERFTRRRGGSGDEAPGRGAAGPEEVAAVECEKGPRDSCGSHSEVKVKRAAVQVVSSSSDSTFVSDTEVGRLDPEKCLPPEVLDEEKTLPIVRYA